MVIILKWAWLSRNSVSKCWNLCHGVGAVILTNLLLTPRFSLNIFSPGLAALHTFSQTW